MVATRTKAKRDSFAVKGMMETVQESGCVDVILGFLPLVDFFHFSICNKNLHNLCKEDPRLLFAQSYSRSWWSWFDRLEDQEYADNHPFKTLRRGGLETDFATLFARTESHMLESIVAWCGGWEAFLQARSSGASLGQPTSMLRAGDDNKVHNLCKPVVIFDIHCDNEWKWTALHPLCNDDLRTTYGAVDDDDDHGVFYPYSTKCLGDETDAGTAYPWNHGRRPQRYLLSTDASDSRNYKFSVSIVSPNFGETFVESYEIVPSQICESEGFHWFTASNVFNDWVARDQSFRTNPSLLMASRWGSYHGGTRRHFGRKENGDPVNHSPRLRFTYYRDQQNTDRLHVTMEVWFNTKHFYDMLVHPQAEGATSTLFKKRSRKRRL